MSTMSYASLLMMLSALILSFMLFRDLADISQWFIRTDRKKTMSTFYKRHWLTLLLAFLWVGGLWAGYAAGFDQMSIIALMGASALIGFFFFMGCVNPALMMRPQQSGARYYDIADALPHMGADTSLIVVETDAGVFGHPDRHVLRPHVAGIPDDPNGTVLTYCGLTNMGIAYIPEIDGARLELGVMTQLENNLVLWDKTSGEPIQQFWGTKESDEKNGPKMGEVATYRMPFYAFKLKFPQGKVFLNLFPKVLSNPFFCSVRPDHASDFLTCVDEQASKDAPTFPTIDHFDDRLPNKAKVYGANLGDIYFAVTKDHILKQGGRIDLSVNETIIHIVYHKEFDSVGMYDGSEITIDKDIAFGGETEAGSLDRLNTMKAEAFWVVWQNFYPQTIVNPVTGPVTGVEIDSAA